MQLPHRHRGERWPAEMMLSIENHAAFLLELLWLREAWQLTPTGADLPPLLTDTPQAIEHGRDTAPLADWTAAWPQLWQDCLTHAATPRERSIDRLERTPAGSPERHALLRQLVGPNWTDRFGRDAFDESYEAWSRRDFERVVGQTHDDPERQVLDALVPAWRAGLLIIVEIPCQGTYTRPVGRHALLLTTETRADLGRYQNALAHFPGVQ